MDVRPGGCCLDAVLRNQPRPTVVLFEDDPDQLILLTELIESAHFAVLGASNSVAPLELIESSNPDVVVTDLH